MAITFPCSECRKPISIHFASPGDDVMCQACGTHQRVPKESAAPPRPEITTPVGAIAGTNLAPADDTSAAEAEPSETIELDPAQLEYVRQRLETEQSFPLAFAAGFAAALIGATAWALVTVISNFQIGFMAVGVGFLVGYAVRTAGKGISNVFGFIGAGLSLFGCLLGNLLSAVGFISKNQGMSVMDVMGRLTPEIAVELITMTFSAIDLLFYGIALYYGYKLSFRQLTVDEVKRMTTGGAG